MLAFQDFQLTEFQDVQDYWLNSAYHFYKLTTMQFVCLHGYKELKAINNRSLMWCPKLWSLGYLVEVTGLFDVVIGGVVPYRSNEQEC